MFDFRPVFIARCERASYLDSSAAERSLSLSIFSGDRLAAENAGKSQSTPLTLVVPVKWIACGETKSPAQVNEGVGLATKT